MRIVKELLHILSDLVFIAIPFGILLIVFVSYTIQADIVGGLPK